jgi:hypothetical protein
MSNSRPVQRIQADRDWLLMVVSFGVSVVGTRLYLEATGYPQIGNGTLHIAHVLWGGLLLFLALAVFLTFANRWSYSASAILGGAGVGLFIDEVGKFITQNNDYFFPFAAPIIYAFFLLMMFLYLQLRRLRPHSVRSDLYWVLDQLKDIVDMDFDLNERARVESVLSRVVTEPQSTEQRQVAEALLALVQAVPAIEPPHPTLIQRCAAALRTFEERYISRTILKSGLVTAFIVSSFGGLAVIVLLISIAGDNQVRDQFIGTLLSDSFVGSPASLQWLLVQTVLTAMMGVLYLVAGLLLLARWDTIGIRTGRFGLMLELTVVNVLAFYFSQFAMILSTLVALGVLLAVERYRTRFLSVRAQAAS